ncbi:TPA: helix-turn-helix domain-containing protein [Legionella pneumophila]|uniref:DNA-binding transcriptional regulator n=1 Tax=Legionella waltersii TaxID=66969 RepID=A0A0W1A0L9_9GAMM|nr:XRE family transcriptional regulator [Legionella waltersii]HAU3626782.1 helix-turn-helix domain-containing protein [Legionella pneumophila]KTD74897.1 DNA-binding transcriptional regulator [Legionella waltersii]SNV12139.1 DNA-binding transcriptional regulator [Legionella waltersii]HAU3646511.1 helix-turn-helix domain-containing protein [Legionella pneumophila]HAU3652870.1 helix-turn-helix domain-containing protein [Legionella pneumophila]
MNDIYSHISLTLKTLRRDRGWSLDKAAEKTGVSKAMLGQIERQESSPTIATLWKIASGFQTSFSSFIADISTNFNEPIYRAGHVQQIHPTDEKIRVMPLFPFDNELNFELFVIELLPSCEHLSPPHEHGVIEHVVVVDGTIEVLVDGVWKSLSKGEGLRFNANQVHGYRNITSKTSIFHDIIHYPPKL